MQSLLSHSLAASNCELRTAHCSPRRRRRQQEHKPRPPHDTSCKREVLKSIPVSVRTLALPSSSPSLQPHHGLPGGCFGRGVHARRPESDGQQQRQHCREQRQSAVQTYPASSPAPLLVPEQRPPRLSQSDGELQLPTPTPTPGSDSKRCERWWWWVPISRPSSSIIVIPPAAAAAAFPPPHSRGHYHPTLPGHLGPHESPTGEPHAEPSFQLQLVPPRERRQPTECGQQCEYNRSRHFVPSQQAPPTEQQQRQQQHDHQQR